MKIQNIHDASYGAYGRVLTDSYPVELLLQYLDTVDAPVDHVVYEPSISQMEELSEAILLRDGFFGGIDIQIGYCNGTNRALNALEYHRCSELGVAATDLILLLGRMQDIDQKDHYDTSLVEAFYVPRGTVYEMYATTLHYAPCSVDGKPFRNVVVLPRGTNTALGVVPGSAQENHLITAVNKWLIAHKEAGIEGAFVGLDGINVCV